MKFNCFPRKQKGIFLVYSNTQLFHSELFRGFITQASAKNSIFFRFLKTKVGLKLSALFQHNIQVSNEDTEYIGIVKNLRIILFEMKGDLPICVWRNTNSDWVKEKFLGYQLISEYSIKEFDSKYELIEEALNIHWLNLKNGKDIHGDFTHFNILIDEKRDISFIDKKTHINSKLYDFFYFYSYLKQCLDKCLTLSRQDEAKILSVLKRIIKRVCCFENKEQFLVDYEQIKIPERCALRHEKREEYLQEFLIIFTDNLDRSYN